MGRWKDGAHCAVMLTFDVDAETLWLSGDMANLNKPGMISQGTYGARVATPLILEMLRERRLPATFFVPGWTAEQHADIVASIHEHGHEIGHHGWIHEWPTNLTRDEEERVLTDGIAALSRITGVAPAGYRSPAWEFSVNTLELLDAHGFGYSSNLMSDFVPWMHSGTALVELPVQWILDDAPFFLYGGGRTRPINSAQSVYEVWTEEFRGIYRHGGLFNLTMHPQIIGRPGRLMMLERFIDYVRGFPNVWFACGADVASFWRESGA